MYFIFHTYFEKQMFFFESMLSSFQFNHYENPKIKESSHFE